MRGIELKVEYALYFFIIFVVISAIMRHMARRKNDKDTNH
jgi:hypothetical protein